MSNIVTSLKRLERAGSETGKTTRKLIEAAADVALQVERIVGEADCEDVALPRGYEVLHHHGARHLVTPEVEEVCYGTCYPVRYTLNPGSDSPTPDANRGAALLFAKDLASGWLEELAAFLEDRAAEDKAASETLEAAKTN